MTKPAERFHVGEYLEDLLTERGWTIHECARRMGGDWLDFLTNVLVVEQLIEAWHASPDSPLRQVKMCEETAAGLERAFGVEAETWLRLDRSYHENSDVKTLSKVEVQALEENPLETQVGGDHLIESEEQP